MDNEKQRAAQRNIEVDLRDEIAAGSYANLAIISHSQKEFVLDFAAMLPGMAKPRVTNRIVVTPEHARGLLASLQENINRYESQYGPIAPQHMSQANQQEEILTSITNHKIGEA